MRRYDAGYRMLKQAVDSEIGQPLMVHAAHRNPTVPEQYVTPMAIHDTLIHEIDVFRWLLDDDYVSAQVVFPRAHLARATRSSRTRRSSCSRPRRASASTSRSSSTAATATTSSARSSARRASPRLPEPMSIVMRKEAKLQNAILTDWKDRFIASYDVELQDFIDAAAQGHRLRPDLLGRLRRRHLLGRLRRGAGSPGNHRPDLPAGASGALRLRSRPCALP